MGNRCSILRSHHIHPPLTNHSIKFAVWLWSDDPVQAIARYGHIEEWDTSEVTDMSDLFFHQKTFNEDISKWNVSQVSNMLCMFNGAKAFNQDLSLWDVSQVTNMTGMFSGAASFNNDLSGWDVSMVKYMHGMFMGATAFNQDLSGWDVSSVTQMDVMFRGATALEATFLQNSLNVPSFFYGVYRAMPREERRQVFAVAFSWQRRKAFLLFLVNHGYLYSASVASNYERQAIKPSNEAVPCDAIFDVEDICRYICQFL